MREEYLELFEDTRSLLIQLDLINSKINNLRADDFTKLKVKEYLKQLSNNCSAEFLVFNDFLFELSQIESSSELETLIELNGVEDANSD